MLTDKKVKELISQTKGKFFRVDFIKKDNSIRRMICRTGVKKALKKGVNVAKKANPELAIVWDGQKQEYRSFDTHRVLEIKFSGRILK